jgi:threonine/homoserine/homoserine lactone efflux protein
LSDFVQSLSVCLLFIALGMLLILFAPNVARIFSNSPNFTKWFARIIGILFISGASMVLIVLLLVNFGILKSG